jgi:hypothetical protein
VNEHLDAETVARFCARTLSPSERARAFEHLVCCEDCRHWATSYGDMTMRARSTVAKPLIAATLLACAATFACFAVTHFSRVHSMEARVQQRTAVRKTAGRGHYGMRPHVQHDAALPASPIMPGQAWRRVRLTDFAPLIPPANQIALDTPSGERWITMPDWRAADN